MVKDRQAHTLRFNREAAPIVWTSMDLIELIWMR